VASFFFAGDRLQANIWFWVGFNAFILLLLALDLGVFHRKAHEIKFKEATWWSIFWVTLSLLFNLGIYLYAGAEPALQFLTGYLIEKALSADNIFVMVVIFGYFGVPAMYQHRVLFWGILGALVMRGAFILLGTVLINKFHWIIFVFGGLLVYTGAKLAFREEEPVDFEDNAILKMARRFIRVTPQYHGKHFFAVENGRLVATPLFVVLLMIEITDLIFAVDSIPAIFAVTTDPFIVYTSNILAILGLRSLYFLLANVVDKFRYLKYGLAFILVFVGAKMLISDVYKVPVVISLSVIAATLLVTIVLSLVVERREERAGALRENEHKAV